MPSVPHVDLLLTEEQYRRLTRVKRYYRKTGQAIVRDGFLKELDALERSMDEQKKRRGKPGAVPKEPGVNFGAPGPIPPGGLPPGSIELLKAAFGNGSKGQRGAFAPKPVPDGVPVFGEVRDDDVDDVDG